MNKLALVVALLGFASVAVAGKAEKKKHDCGDKYVLGSHRDEGKGLTASEVADVVSTKLPEIQECWTKPADASVVLRFAIDTDGEVQTVEIVGNVPDETQRCIAVASVDWHFPEAAQDSLNDYSITFRAK